MAGRVSGRMGGAVGLTYGVRGLRTALDTRSPVHEKHSQYAHSEMGKAGIKRDGREIEKEKYAEK